jgi:hypothetical protein
MKDGLLKIANLHELNFAEKQEGINLSGWTF